MIILDTKEYKVSFRQYSQSNVDKAHDRYARLEAEYRDDPYKDIVLVSASSIVGVKMAYPNYFADTKDFSRQLEKVLEVMR